MDKLTYYESSSYCHIFWWSLFFSDSSNYPPLTFKLLLTELLLLPTSNYSPWMVVPLLKALAWFQQIIINKEILQGSSL